MINAALLCLIGFIIVYIFRNKAHIAWVGMLFMFIYFALLVTPLHILKQIPFIVVEDSGVEFIENGVFELHSGVTAMIDSEYVITDSIQKEDIENWLLNQHKNVYIYIKKGDNINYSYNLGIVDKKNIESQSNFILDTYNKWVEGQGIPTSEVTVILGTDKIGLFLER